LLGNNLVRELLSRNHEVNVLLLPESAAHSLDGLSIHRFYGNILNRREVQNAMRDCDAVIHAAANTNIWPSRSKLIRQINIGGTQNIIDAVLNEKVTRMIY